MLSPTAEKRKGLFLFFIVLAVLKPAGPLAKEFGTTGADFLTIGAGPRAVGMGEAHVAVADDSYASYWNPAGLGLIDRKETAFMYNRSFLDVTQTHFNAAYPLEGGGAIG